MASSCGIYTFSGTSISPDVKSVQVDYFPNYAPLINPALSRKLTNDLQTRFTDQTNLKLTKNGGDLKFEGEITKYEITPDDAQANNTAAFNRLTITIKVRFYNEIDEKENFENTYSDFEKFNKDKDFTSVEGNLIDLITAKLIDRIFADSVEKW
ncbi:hypothetical protein JBKA6_0054 [Ichthyobacterium seriolicida]|uniref:Lipoprotein n=2 Tax=Ichthyobacterium seriolicida TaxID=242600 RepID=A0A1J1E809_9FLAO|nr:hypothetical protein JBKA6_0054 [Ichthyobacterium seriolicida]